MKPQYILLTVPLLTLLGAEVKAVPLPLQPDNTLGAESSVVTPLAPTQDVVEGGAARGANLFHSFSEFNVNTGASVYFSNPSSIENILTRVTGSNPSEILGTLGVFGDANLFLLNPNGILFGENVQLDINGSFVASTAEGIDFGNGNSYSATNPNSSSLVSVQPGALFHNAVANQTLSNQGNLAVGGDLTLSAGNLDLSGQLQSGGDLTLEAQNVLQLRDSAAAPFNTTTVGDLLVEGNNVDIFILNHPDSRLSSTGTMTLRSDNPIISDGRFSAGGNLLVEKFDSTPGDLISPNDPVFQSRGDIGFGNYSGASLQVLAGGSISVGTITINGPDASVFNNSSVTLSDGSTLNIDGQTRAALDLRAGTTTFFASPPVTAGTTAQAYIDVESIVFADTPATADGLIFLSTQYSPDLTLMGGGIFVGDIVGSNSTGNGATVVIDSRANINIFSGDVDVSSTGLGGNGGDVTFLAQDGIVTQSIDTFSADGAGGNISLDSSNGGIDLNGDLNTSALGTSLANSGTVTLTADGNITTSNIDSSSTDSAGGDILLNSSNGEIGLNGDLNTSALGTSAANGGSVTLSADRDITTRNIDARSRFQDGGAIDIFSDNGNIDTTAGQLRSSVEDPTTGGSGGSITLEAENNINAGSMDSSGGMNGGGGNINIQADDDAFFDGITIRSNTYGALEAGTIDILGDDVEIVNGTIMTSNTFSSGKGGTILTRGRFSLLVDDNSNIETRATSTSSNLAGRISLTSGSDVFINNSSISSNSEGSRNAGNIFVRAGLDATLTIDNSKIFSNVLDGTSGGTRGIITLRGDSVVIRNGTEVSSNTSGRARAGTIQLETDGDGGLFSIANGVEISSSSSGTGDAGDIKFRLRAPNASIFIADSEISSDSTQGDPNSSDRGAIKVEIDPTDPTEFYLPQNIELSNATLSSSTSGFAQAGDVNLQATDNVRISGSEISTVNQGGQNSAGDIDIGGQNIRLENGSMLSSNTEGLGNAGDVTLLGDTVNLDNSKATSANVGGIGNGQNVRIDARIISLSNNSQASSSTAGIGNAGNVNLTATEELSLNNSIASSAVEDDGVGRGGNVTLDAPELELSNNSQATSSTAGTGDAGNVTLLGDTVNLDNSTATSANVGGNGDGQNVRIDARIISLSNNSEVSSSTFGMGDAGNVNLTATKALSLNNSIASSAVEAGGVGRGGDVTLDAPELELGNNSQATSSTAGTGDAGNVTLLGDTVNLDNSKATSANVGGIGNGQNVRIDARIISLSNNSQ
ncbi:MAG: filamentous hemagglutinin N-terminal domain-containing protein, partial [Cyanobacteriota bacterium]|nr:filamentous hemagglutinin N-terminal domain-containing protein [Cyanobacteriota bacterium]